MAQDQRLRHRVAERSDPELECAAIGHRARDVEAGKLGAEAIDEKTFAAALYHPDLPDPDLLIRTGAEHRVSNFLLWQIAYAEIHVTDVMWPDFRKGHLVEALLDFQRRERRFGLVPAQLARAGEEGA